jgi:drug/metabolite transporter (DMT)-like permease
VIGYALWGDVPNGLAFLGIAIVVASGLYILHRERLRRG